MSTFNITSLLPPIDQMLVLSFCGEVPSMSNCLPSVTRPQYLRVDETDMRGFLKRTSIDAYKWREAQPATDTPEMVCSSFAVMLWALLEQERLKSKLSCPLAVAFVKLLYEDPLKAGHATVGFLNEVGEFKFAEPQNDLISAPTPDQIIQLCVFQ